MKLINIEIEIAPQGFFIVAKYNNDISYYFNNGKLSKTKKSLVKTWSDSSSIESLIFNNKMEFEKWEKRIKSWKKKKI